MLSKIPDKALQLLLCEAVTHPVEAGAQVVNQLLSWPHLVDISRKASCLLHAGIGGF